MALIEVVDLPIKNGMVDLSIVFCMFTRPGISVASLRNLSSFQVSFVISEAETSRGARESNVWNLKS
jgi:hypothetical protein